MLKSTLVIQYELLLVLLALNNAVFATEPVAPADSEIISGLIDLSLEELMQIEVITTSKTDQNIHDAPGIISVITAKEIQKFGANNRHYVKVTFAIVKSTY